MTSYERAQQRVANWLIVFGAGGLILAALLALAGCSSGGGGESAPVSPSPSPAVSQSPNSPAPPGDPGGGGGQPIVNPPPGGPGLPQPSDPVAPTPPVGNDPVTPPGVNPPQPGPPPPLVWQVSGSLRDGGTFAGTLSYDPEAHSNATNVRGLAPNVTFPLLDWNIIVTPTVGPAYQLTPFIGGQVEFCVGACIFAASVPSERLFWFDGQHTLQIVMPLPATMQTLRLPVVQADWGVVDGTASWIKSVTLQGVFQYLVLFVSASLQIVVDSSNG